MDYAGFWGRLFAYIVDCTLVSLGVTMVLFARTGEFSLAAAQSNGYYLILALYFTILPAFWHGYTLAKRIAGIRVRKLDGKDATLLDMFVRDFVGKALLTMVTFGITALISLIMVLVMKRPRAIHDYMAGTYVYSE